VGTGFKLKTGTANDCYPFSDTLFVRSHCAFACGTAQVRAGSIDSSKIPVIVVQSDGDANTKIYKPSANDYTANGNDGDFALSNQVALSGIPTASVKVQQLEFNNDPFVLNNVLVTNTLATPQVFTMFVGLPTTFAAPNTISGNVRTSVIDGGNDGASISTLPGQALYQAQVDFATVASLQTDPFSVTAAPGSSATSSATFGPTPSGVPVTSSFGVQLRFMLSPGDTASILSRFDIVPGGTIPEPTTLILGSIMAIVAYGFRGRRAC
jgi:hypothetical protein